MASLSEDLRLLADLEEAHKGAAAAPTAELQKINWQRLMCFSISAYNMIGPMYGLPPVPVPAVCTTPAPTDGPAIP